MSVRFTPSRDATIDTLRLRIVTAFTYPHGHPGIPGIPEGEGCPRCNAEHALDAALARLEAAEAQNAEKCPDCGIPLVWCRRVTINASHCWRWDYERFDEAATQRDALAEALRTICDIGETRDVEVARAALADAGLIADSDTTTVFKS